MEKMKQTNLFAYFDKKDVRKRYGRTQHGGVKTRGHRKLERPLSTKNWIHLILKSDKAKGPLSFLLPKNKQIIQSILRKKSKKFGVTLADGANVGNHLHLKIKIQNRESFQKFLKSVTCLIARQVTGACRGKKFGRFWQGLAFTRVLTSSLEELNLKGYINANRIQAGRGEKARESFLQNFNAWVYRERVRDKFLQCLDPSLVWVFSNWYLHFQASHAASPTLIRLKLRRNLPIMELWELFCLVWFQWRFSAFAHIFLRVRLLFLCQFLIKLSFRRRLCGWDANIRSLL